MLSDVERCQIKSAIEIISGVADIAGGSKGEGCSHDARLAVMELTLCAAALKLERLLIPERSVEP